MNSKYCASQGAAGDGGGIAAQCQPGGPCLGGGAAAASHLARQDVIASLTGDRVDFVEVARVGWPVRPGRTVHLFVCRRRARTAPSALTASEELIVATRAMRGGVPAQINSYVDLHCH